MNIYNTHFTTDDIEDPFKDQDSIMDNLNIERLVDYPRSDEEKEEDREMEEEEGK